MRTSETMPVFRRDGALLSCTMPVFVYTANQNKMSDYIGHNNH